MATKPALSFTTRAASLLSCAAEQTIPTEAVSGGIISLTVETEVGQPDSQDDTLSMQVKVRVDGIDKATNAPLFFAQCAYRQIAVFDRAIQKKDLDSSTGDRLLKPLYYLALNHCQDMAWRMGHPIPRTLPEIDLFKTEAKPRPARRATRKTAARPT